MDNAFVLIHCEPGKEPVILDNLRKIDNVVEAQGTYGIYDIVARIESDSKSQLDTIISNQIRKLDYVNSTLTLIPTENEEDTNKLIPEIILDVIPDEKKPLEEQTSEGEEGDDEGDYDEDYDEKGKLN